MDPELKSLPLYICSTFFGKICDELLDNKRLIRRHLHCFFGRFHRTTYTHCRTISANRRLHKRTKALSGILWSIV